VAYVIDSLNPRTWNEVLRALRLQQVERAIIPWWTVFWAPSTLFLARGLQRAGIPVTLLCHNVVEHESTMWKQRLTKTVLQAADRFVVHTSADADNLRRLLPSAPVAVHPHPVYDRFPPPKAAPPRRAGFELLFYGFVRPYKGLDLLVEALGLVTDDDVYLTVAGEFWQGEAEFRARIAELGLQQKIELAPRYHSDDETAALFARADLVVLPYRSATGSGVIPLAYHYGKPVLATRTGGLVDVVEDGVTGFLVPPNNPAALAAGLHRARGFRPPDAAFAMQRERMSWSGLARLLLEGGDPQ
jgi:glycosyltransferase involved in cell wall biosynthesis